MSLKKKLLIALVSVVCATAGAFALVVVVGLVAMSIAGNSMPDFESKSTSTPWEAPATAPKPATSSEPAAPGLLEVTEEPKPEPTTEQPKPKPKPTPTPKPTGFMAYLDENYSIPGLPDPLWLDLVTGADENGNILVVNVDMYADAEGEEFAEPICTAARFYLLDAGKAELGDFPPIFVVNKEGLNVSTC